MATLQSTRLGIRAMAFALVGLSAACGAPRQTADADFDTRIARPTYVNEHPLVLFDQAHRNIHTAGGLYKPFASLISNDGYHVVPNEESFSAQSLRRARVLVIANALGTSDSNDNSAFSEDECDAVRDWVRDGGALLLITDHAPTGGAAENLAHRFGVLMSKGFTEDPDNYDKESGDNTQIVFTRANGLLVDHPITDGRDSTERVDRVMSFRGQSLKSSSGGTPFLKLGKNAVNRPPSIKVEKSNGGTRVVITYGAGIPAAGYSQAIALQFGRGRVVVFGEASMLTAQLDGKTRQPFGMNVKGIDNRQLALNVMHWLSGSLK